MKIKQIMEKPVFISLNATKNEILKAVKKHPRTELFIVVDKIKRFLGDMHENDLFYMFIPNEMYEDIGVELAFDLEKKFFAKSAKEIMRRHDISCSEDDEVDDVAIKFAGEEVNEMPVLNNNGKVVGVVNQGAVLRHMKIK